MNNKFFYIFIILIIGLLLFVFKIFNSKHIKGILVNNKNYKLKLRDFNYFMNNFNTLEIYNKLKNIKNNNYKSNLLKLLVNNNNYSFKYDSEILLALLGSPVLIKFNSINELKIEIKLRNKIIEIARKTKMNLRNNNYPKKYFFKNNNDDLILNRNKNLVEGLNEFLISKNNSYASGCRLTVERVFLLALCILLKEYNYNLYLKIEEKYKNEPITNIHTFDKIFIKHIGSELHPLPIKYYIPGDKIYFRNPFNEVNSISGYEGKWMIYLGYGEFSDFFKDTYEYTYYYHYFTLDEILLELYLEKFCIISDENGFNDIDCVFLTQITKLINNDKITKKAILDFMYKQKYDVFDYSRDILKPINLIKIK